MDDRLIIINADDFGMTEGTNEAIIQLFDDEAISSASIMMPCSTAKQAIAQSTQKVKSHIGIHLTLSSDENQRYRPVFQERPLYSLMTADGYFHKDISYLENNADPEEVRIELDAQIQNAILFGIEPTHLDSHAGSILGLHAGRDFLEIAFDLCEKYRLPFNIPQNILKQTFFSSEQKERFEKRIVSAKKRGIVLIDDMVSLPYRFEQHVEYEEAKEQFATLIKNLKPGITQLTAHPSFITIELKALTPCYRERYIEYKLLNDIDIKPLFLREGIKQISWQHIRDYQRSNNRANAINGDEQKGKIYNLSNK